MDGQFNALLTADDIGFLDTPDGGSGFYFPICGQMDDNETNASRSRFENTDAGCIPNR